jgi:hypothetical protein
MGLVSFFHFFVQCWTIPRAVNCCCVRMKSLFLGVTERGIQRECEFTMNTRDRNDEVARKMKESGRQLEGLAILETALPLLAQVNLPRVGLARRERRGSFEADAGTVLAGILPALERSIASRQKIQLSQKSPNKPLSMYNAPDRGTCPYNVEGFQCQVCKAELANTYLKCDGCDRQNFDFNLCLKCYSGDEYTNAVKNPNFEYFSRNTCHVKAERKSKCQRVTFVPAGREEDAKQGPVVFHAEHCSNRGTDKDVDAQNGCIHGCQKCKKIPEKANAELYCMPECAVLNGRRTLCDKCGKCITCSCTCHSKSEFTLMHRFKTPEEETELLERVKARVKLSRRT